MFTLHFCLTSYLRLRFKILNDYNLDLYKGRPAFSWSDVVVEMTRFTGLPLQNRLVSKCNKTFYNIIPKRDMRTVAEKVIENPEAKKMIITTGAAALAAGIAAASDLFLTPEARALKKMEQLVKKAEEEQEKALRQLERFPKPSELITQKGVKVRENLESDAATAYDTTQKLKGELSDLRAKPPERTSLTAPDPDMGFNITDFSP